jgi:hypothetical protein
MKEKYEKLDSECKDTKNKIDCLRCKNKNIEIRIDELKDKYDYIKKIRSDNDKNELNLNKLDNAYKYSENIKLKTNDIIEYTDESIKKSEKCFCHKDLPYLLFPSLECTSLPNY